MSFGQSTTFYSKYVELYKGKRAVISKEYEDYYSNSSIKLKLISEIIKPLKLKKNMDTLLRINALDLKGDTLIFDDAQPIQTVNEYTKQSNYKLLLKSLKSGKRYILDYDPEISFYFPFTIIDKLSIPNGYFCNEISQRKDKFTGKIITETPTGEKIAFVKMSDSGEISYYLRLLSYSSSLSSYLKTGVIVLLQDGSKVEFKDCNIEILEKSHSGIYTYLAMQKLDQETLKKLSKGKIEAYRMFVDDSTINDFEAVKAISLLNCLTN